MGISTFSKAQIKPAWPILFTPSPSKANATKVSHSLRPSLTCYKPLILLYLATIFEIIYLAKSSFVWLIEQWYESSSDWLLRNGLLWSVLVSLFFANWRFVSTNQTLIMIKFKVGSKYGKWNPCFAYTVKLAGIHKSSPMNTVVMNNRIKLLFSPIPHS